MFGADRRKTGGGMSLGPRQSVAITPTKRFTDYGPSSMRKPDGRASLSHNIGQPRPSLFGTKNSAVAPRDVKGLVTANVSKIYSFLIEFEGSEAPSEKDIKSPRGKNDFTFVFELIYQHLSKDYEYPQSARIEDEIPQIFKGLQYPVTLKNSYFQPMGSSHGYPHLLDALAWLVDLVRINSCVSADTQNIIFGDFMEQAIVQEKTLNYAWMSTTFRDYTNDRKAAENPETPFWDETKCRLRKYFEESNEFDDMAKTASNGLEQLRFECEEIESERGNEQSLLEEIAKIKDDIRKATEFFESTEQVKELKEKELARVKLELEAKMAEHERAQRMVNELKARIEMQKTNHGLSGKEVRQLNIENNRDKETVAEIQAELDSLSKEAWRLNKDDSFKEQKAKFVQLYQKTMKIIAGLDIQLNLDPIKAPADERQLKTCWEALNGIWLPEINRQLHQKKLELETKNSRFADNFAHTEQRIQMESEMLCEAKKKEAREERIRRNERDEWKEARQQMEKRYDELENEKEVLKKQMQMDGSLEKEIEAERVKMTKIEKELEEKKKYLETSIRQKLDQIVAETAEIENEKIMFHVECTELEKTVKAMCLN